MSCFGVGGGGTRLAERWHAFILGSTQYQPAFDVLSLKYPSSITSCPKGRDERKFGPPTLRLGSPMSTFFHLTTSHGPSTMSRGRSEERALLAPNKTPPLTDRHTSGGWVTVAYGTSKPNPGGLKCLISTGMQRYLSNQGTDEKGVANKAPSPSPRRHSVNSSARPP